MGARGSRGGSHGGTMMRVILVACLLGCLSAAAIAGKPDTFNCGLAAFRAHDNAAAVADFRHAAQEGDARAQTALGVMYHNGQGVPQDDNLAATFFRLAAQQGDVAAKFKLGLMYAQGQGVPQDDAKAYKWFALAKAASKPGSHAYIVTNRDMRILKASMSSAQIAQGQLEAAVWRTVHPKGG